MTIAIYYLLFFVGVLANIIAQILLKTGANSQNHMGSIDILSKLKFMALNPFLLGALFFYAISFITYSIVLAKIELSKAYPIASVLAIVAVTIISVIFWHESTGLLKITGLILCIIGIFLIF